MADLKGEMLVKTLATKKVYNYIDTEKAINQISREIFSNKDQIVHYPRGFEGGDKYKTIKKFTFNGFKGNLPVGVFKSANFGWGFTKPLYPFTDYIVDNYDFVEVVIEKGGKVQMDFKNKKLYLNETSLDVLQKSFKSIFIKNRAEVDFVLQINLHKIFPLTIPQPTKTYISDALANSLASWETV